MPAIFAGAGGRREARALVIAWWSRRHMLPRPEFLLLLPLGPVAVGRVLERAGARPAPPSRGSEQISFAAPARGSLPDPRLTCRRGGR